MIRLAAVRWGALLGCAVLACCLLAGGQVAAAAGSARWRTHVFALVPAPGHPAYVHVARNGRVYAGTYTSGDRQRSRVFEWRRDGTLLRSWTVPGQRLDAEHGVQVANETHRGRLVLLETSTRSVLTLDTDTGRFHRVARLPQGATPNYATWAPGGLYVTDYAQGVIWRVRHDGRVSTWFSSPKLDGVLGFGTTGIRYRQKQHDLLIAQQTVGDGSTLPTNGHLYSLPVHHRTPGRLHTLWTSQPTDLPDGFGVARSGHVYIAMAGLTNRIVEVSARGKELDSFPDSPLTGDNGSSVPFDTPCSATFLGTSVLVANQSAIEGDASHEAILRVHVGERAQRPYLPRSAGFH